MGCSGRDRCQGVGGVTGVCLALGFLQTSELATAATAPAVASAPQRQASRGVDFSAPTVKPSDIRGGRVSPVVRARLPLLMLLG
jgi:hypothetical protein